MMHDPEGVPQSILRRERACGQNLTWACINPQKTHSVEVWPDLVKLRSEVASEFRIPSLMIFRIILRKLTNHPQDGPADHPLFQDKLIHTVNAEKKKKMSIISDASRLLLRY